MNCKEQVSLIVLSIEKCFQLKRSVFFFKLKDLIIDFLGILLISVILFLIQFDEVIGLVNVGEEFLKWKKCILYGINLGENGISILLVSPEIRFKCLLFKLCKFRS
jgi:hypothetical protein